MQSIFVLTCSSLLTPASPQAGHGEKAAGEPPQDLKRSQPILQLMGAHCRAPTALLTFPVIIVDCLMDVCTIGSYYTLILSISGVWFARAWQGHDTCFFQNMFSSFWVITMFFWSSCPFSQCACSWEHVPASDVKGMRTDSSIYRSTVYERGGLWPFGLDCARRAY